MSRQVSFSIDGQWLVDHARQRMLDGHEGQAYEILSTLIGTNGVGAGVGIASEILAGNKSLVGVNDVELVDETPERREDFRRRAAFTYDRCFLIDGGWWSTFGIIRQTAELVSSLARYRRSRRDLERRMADFVNKSMTGDYMVRWVENRLLIVGTKRTIEPPSRLTAIGDLRRWCIHAAGGSVKIDGKAVVVNTSLDFLDRLWLAIREDRAELGPTDVFERGSAEGNRSGVAGFEEIVVFKATPAPPGILQPDLLRRAPGSDGMPGLPVFMYLDKEIQRYSPDAEDEHLQRSRDFWQARKGRKYQARPPAPALVQLEPEDEPDAAHPRGPSPEVVAHARAEIRRRADARESGWWSFAEPMPDGRRIMVPRGAFLAWALKSSGLGAVRQHPDVSWEPVSGSSWKMPEDDRNHTDWMVGAITTTPDGDSGCLGLDEWHYSDNCPLRSLAYGEMDRAQDWARETCGSHNVITTVEDLDRLDRVEALTARFVKSEAARKGDVGGQVKVITHCGEGEVMGRIYYPEPGEECPETGQVAIVPNGTESYEDALRTAACAVLLRGGALCHVVVVARGEGLRVVQLTASAREPIPEGTPVRVDLDAGTITVVEEVDVEPGRRRARKGSFEAGVDLRDFLTGG